MILLDLIAFSFPRKIEPNVWELMKVWKYTQLIFNQLIERERKREEGCAEVEEEEEKIEKIFGFAPEIDSIYCKQRERGQGE